MRLRRVFVLTSAVLAAAAACVSTSGLDAPPENLPEAGTDASLDDAPAADTSSPIDTGPTDDGGITDAMPEPDAPLSDGGTIDDLKEEFAAALDPNLWSMYVPAPFTFNQASEQLHFSCQTKVNGGYAYIKTNPFFDATNGSLRVNLVTTGNAGISSETNLTITWVKWYDVTTSGAALEIGVRGGDLYAKHFIAGTGTTVASTKYLPATMPWVRIRTNAGTVFYEFAQSAAGPWNPLFSETATMTLGAVRVEIGVGGYPGTPGELIYDHINGQ